jgi:putative transcriptional regulator
LAELRNRLKDFRVARGLTQEGLARAAGVTRQTIIAIEKEKFVPSTRLALQLARALNVAFGELFSLEEGKGRRS